MLALTALSVTLIALCCVTMIRFGIRCRFYVSFFLNFPILFVIVFVCCYPLLSVSVSRFFDLLISLFLSKLCINSSLIDRTTPLKTIRIEINYPETVTTQHSFQTFLIHQRSNDRRSTDILPFVTYTRDK